jgi:hypothetical protein
MTRPAIRNHIANAMTAQALVRAKCKTLDAVDIYTAGLSSLTDSLWEARNEAQRLVDALDAAHSEAAETSAREWDAQWERNRALMPLDTALDLIGVITSPAPPMAAENVLKGPWPVVKEVQS